MARVAFVVIAIAITIYAVADIARTPSDEMPARVPKALWLLLAVLLTPLGGIAWIIVSRVTQAEARGGQMNRGMWYSDNSALRTRFSSPSPEPREPVAPDDDVEFLWKLEKQVRLQHQKDAERKAHESDGTQFEDSNQDVNLNKDAAGNPDSSNSTVDPSENLGSQEHPRPTHDSDDSGNADDAGDTDGDSKDDDGKNPPAAPLA